MEVGDKSVQHFEFVTRIDKNVGPSRTLRQSAILCREALDGAAGGGAYADHPSPIFLGLVNGVSRFLGNRAELGVHLMVVNVLRFHRAKCPKSHMQCHVADLYAYVSYLLQQFRSKVQPGCRRGSGPSHFGVDSLIPLLVLKLCFDVGWQGHFAQLLQNLQKDSLIVKPDSPLPVLQLRLYGRSEVAITENHLGSRLQFPPGTDQALPQIFPFIDKKKYFTGPSARPATNEPGGKDPGIVEYHTIPRS